MIDTEKTEPDLTELKNNKNKKRNYYKTICFVKWISFNWIFTFCFPIGCIFIAIFLTPDAKILDFNFVDIVKMAYFSGAYIFVGATVLISMFYEIKIKNAVDFGFLFIILLFLSLFYSNEEQINNGVKIISILNLYDYWRLFLGLNIICFIVTIDKKLELLKLLKNKL